MDLLCLVPISGPQDDLRFFDNRATLLSHVQLKPSSAVRPASCWNSENLDKGQCSQQDNGGKERWVRGIQEI